MVGMARYSLTPCQKNRKNGSGETSGRMDWYFGGMISISKAESDGSLLRNSGYARRNSGKGRNRHEKRLFTNCENNPRNTRRAKRITDNPRSARPARKSADNRRNTRNAKSHGISLKELSYQSSLASKNPNSKTPQSNFSPSPTRRGRSAKH